jgi:LAO/AO transport system kinase
VKQHRARLTAAGEFETRRRGQRLRWMWDQIEDRLMAALKRSPEVCAVLDTAQAEVAAGTLAPGAAALRVLEAFRRV